MVISETTSMLNGEPSFNYIHTYIHTHTHTYTDTYIHTHTHITYITYITYTTYITYIVTYTITRKSSNKSDLIYQVNKNSTI